MHSENAWIPNDFVCLDCCAGGGSVFGNSPKYKGDSAQFFLKSPSVGLLGDMSPMHRSRPEWGRDT